MKCHCGAEAICILAWKDGTLPKPLCLDCKNYWQSLAEAKPEYFQFQELPLAKTN